MAGEANRRTFLQLLQGGVGYVCDPNCLAATEKNTSFAKAKNNLVTKIKKLINQLETTEKRIRKFYIGKTSIDVGKVGWRFNRLNSNTWDKSNINGRYKDHNGKGYGRHGLIVIAVITKKQVPKGSINLQGKHQEYTLMLEQELIKHYLLEVKDCRCVNDNTTTGRLTKDYAASALYVAFSYFPEPQQLNNCQHEAGTLGYVCNPHDMVKISHRKFNGCGETLVNKINEQLGAHIREFDIGMTYIKPIERRRKLNPRNPDTWAKDGIHDKMYYYHETESKYDRLIVIAAIQRKQVPTNIVNLNPQKAYSLELLEHLFLHYRHTDKRCAMKIINIDTAFDKVYPGYVIYIAFKYEVGVPAVMPNIDESSLTIMREMPMMEDNEEESKKDTKEESKEETMDA